MHKKRVKNKFYYYYTTVREGSRTKSVYLGKNFFEAKKREQQLFSKSQIFSFNWKAFLIPALLAFGFFIFLYIDHLGEIIGLTTSVEDSSYKVMVTGISIYQNLTPLRSYFSKSKITGFASVDNDYHVQAYSISGSAQSSCGDYTCPSTCADHGVSCSDVGCTRTRSICTYVGCALPSSYCPSGWQGPPNPYSYSCYYFAQCLPTPFLCGIGCIASTCGVTSCPGGWTLQSTPSCDDTYKYCSWSDPAITSPSVKSINAPSEDSPSYHNETLNMSYIITDPDANNMVSYVTCFGGNETETTPALNITFGNADSLKCTNSSATSWNGVTCEVTLSGSNFDVYSIATGNFTCKFYAYDGDATVSSNEDTIMTDAAPYWAAEGLNTTIDEDTQIDVDSDNLDVGTAGNCTDIDSNESAVVTFQLGPTSGGTWWINGSATVPITGANLSYLPSANLTGDPLGTALISCYTPGGLDASNITVGITVTGIDDAPWWDSIGNDTAMNLLKNGGTQPIDVNASSYWRDVEDGQAVNNITISTNTTNLDCFMNTANNFTIFCTPPTGFLLDFIIILNGTDSSGDSVVESFEGYVIETNNAPICNVSEWTNKTINEDTSTDVDTDMSLYTDSESTINCSDPDGDTLTYSFTSNPNNIFAITDNTNLSVQGNSNVTGEVLAQLSVSDQTVYTYFDINTTLNAVNDVPWWNSIDNSTYSFNEDSNEPLSTLLNASSFFQDVENVQTPANITITTNTTNIDCYMNTGTGVTNNFTIFCQTFNPNATDDFIITLNGTDSDAPELSSTISFEAKVNAVNDNPWWNETSNTTYAYGENFGNDYTVWDEDGLNNTYWDIENEGENHLPHNCTAETNDTSIITNVEYNGSVIADSIANITGQAILTINCSDNSGESAVTNFEITINHVNDAPFPVLLDTPLNETNYTVIPEFNWSNTTDLDNDAIYYILQIGSDPSFAEPVSYYNGSIKETENTTGDVSVGNSLTTGGNYFWRVASTDLQDNSSEWSEVRSFTFTPPSVPGPEAPGGGGGGGGAAGGRYAPPSMELSQSLVKVTIKQGETKTVELKIKNPSDTTRTVSIDLQDLKKFVLLSETSFTLKPYEEKTITLDFTASSTEPSEVYTGKILVKTESGQQIVRLILEVLERKALFDIISKISEEFKKVKIGEEVEADIVLYNLGDLMPVDVTLSYAIKDFENNTIEFKQETFAVEEQTKLKRKIKIPEYLKPDFYTFYTLVEYNGQRAVSSDVFEVEEKVEKKSPWEEFFKRYETVFITGLLILVIIIFSIMLSYMIIKTREVYFKKEEPEKPTQITEISEFLNKIEKEKIEEYIQQKLKEGYTEKRIIEAARKSGWNEKLVKSLLEEAKTKPI